MRMRIYFDGLLDVYMVRIGDGTLLGPFGSIAEIQAAYLQEFTASFPDSLDIGQDGNVKHRISTEGK